MTAAEQFHVRFGLHVDVSEAERRFLNRVAVDLYGRFFLELARARISHEVIELVAFILGEPYDGRQPIAQYGGGQFLPTLRLIEAIFAASPKEYKDQCEQIIRRVLAVAEIDLGVSWSGGVFRRNGAPELDRSLIDEPLTWIREAGLETVYQPFSKALTHLVSSADEPERLFDVITDAYESVEAMSQVVTGRRGDLYGNRDEFVARLGLSQPGVKLHRGTLKEYIDYANQYRHPPRGGARSALTGREAEAFIYFSGMILRMAILASRASTPAPPVD